MQGLGSSGVGSVVRAASVSRRKGAESRALHPGRGAKPPDRALLRCPAFPGRGKKRCNRGRHKADPLGGGGAKKSSSDPVEVGL